MNCGHIEVKEFIKSPVYKFDSVIRIQSRQPCWRIGPGAGRVEGAGGGGYDLKLNALERQKLEVNYRILMFCQPHRVTSRRGRNENGRIHGSR